MFNNSVTKVFALDLDGTVYVGDYIIDGAADLISFLLHEGMVVQYFTNSSTRTRKQILNKLLCMGLTLALDDIYSSAYATAVFIAEKSWSKVFCLGAEGLKNEIEERGITITNDPALADALIIGLDTGLTYNSLAEIMPFRNRKTPIVACNLDSNFPVGDDKYLPGCGPIVAAVEDALERKSDYIVGKPNTYMLDLLSGKIGCTNTDVIIVGDSYESDIQMAKNYGCNSFLISREETNDVEGTVVVSKIADILQHLSSVLVN